MEQEGLVRLELHGWLQIFDENFSKTTEQILKLLARNFLPYLYGSCMKFENQSWILKQFGLQTLETSTRVLTSDT